MAIAADDIKVMAAGLTPYTARMVLNAELGPAINSVNGLMAGKTRDQLAPKHDLIFNAFRICPIECTKVIIIGQDPYISPGQAQGMSFSLPDGVKITPSIRNIYDALVRSGEMRAAPDHANLTPWAAQGVLLINATFTTVLGVSNAHKAAWKQYTAALLRNIAARPTVDGLEKPICLLFGNDAISFEKLLNGCHILKWCHPSPLANKGDSPSHFKYCDSFKRANEILRGVGSTPIDWNLPIPVKVPAPVVIPVVVSVVLPDFTEVPRAIPDGPEKDVLYVFTDGGAEKNGTARCRAKWGVYIAFGGKEFAASGDVPLIDIPGREYKTSNQRGELMGLMYGLQYALQQVQTVNVGKVVVTSDSDYSIKCITTWYEGWLKKPTQMRDKMNLDLIGPAYEAYMALKKAADIKIQHINSHTRLSQSATNDEKFYWGGNNAVDRLAGFT